LRRQSAIIAARGRNADAPETLAAAGLLSNLEGASMISRLISVLAVLAALTGTALADTVTAVVDNWDPATKILTLDSEEEFLLDTKGLVIPEGLKAGDTVTIDYASNDNGVTAINSIVIAQ
jgi:hypothetical protein